MDILVHPDTVPGLQTAMTDVFEHVTFAESEEMFIEGLSEADIVVTRTWSDAYMDCMEAVDAIQSISSGIDHFPVDELAEREVTVWSAAGANAEATSEHVFGFILAEARAIHDFEQHRDRQEWTKDSMEAVDGIFPREIAGSTLLMVGVGEIGRQVARKAAAFDMEVHGLDPFPDTSFPYIDEWYTPDQLHTAIEDADYIVLGMPLTDETQGMFGAEEFAAMNEDAMLVNVARGEVIVEDELVTALEQGELRCAALDVFCEEPLPEDSPFWELENCLITPHYAGLTPRYGERLVEQFKENLETYGDVDAAVVKQEKNR